MKVYDIALVIVRTLVAFDLIREMTSLILTGFQLMLISNATLRGYDLASLVSVVFQILSLLLALALSRPIARFASSFAGPADTAAQF